MKNTILICTNNLIPKNLLKKVVENAADQAIKLGDTQIVIVSHYPVVENYEKVDLLNCKDQVHDKLQSTIIKEPFIKSFPIISNYVVGEKEYSIDTIFKQMLFGSSKVDSESIIIMEHDILYPPNYLKKTSSIIGCGFDICFWQSLAFFSLKGFFRFKSVALSRYSFKKSFFDLVFLEKMVRKSLTTEPFLLEYESFAFADIKTEEKFFSNYAVIHETDVLDIKHGLNTSGQLNVEKYEDEHPFWGKAEDISKLIDDNYKETVNKNISYSYGLW
jgi:hypothetical protein